MGRPTAIQLEPATEATRDDATNITSAIAPVELTAAADRNEPIPRSNLQRETSTLSENIIRIITNRNWETLLPNTGNSVEVGQHQVCVTYDEDTNAEYRTWEWQGHILLFDDEEQMYVPEYVYGNYFEPLLKLESPYEGFLDRPSYGLTGIINSIERRQNRTT